MKKSKHILVVDDDKQILKQMEKQLKDKGFEVSTAVNGKEALEKIEKETPDVITLDVMMPEMDGYETCYHLKENPKTSKIPVIMVTSRGKMKAKLASFSFGADFYIAKPFEIEDLLGVVKKALAA